MDKPDEMKSKSDTLSEDLFEATSGLAENLRQSESILHFHEVNQAMMDDPEATRLIKEFTELQQKIRSEQFTGNYTEDDITQFRQLQVEVSTNDFIQEQAYSREMAVAFLREINQEISNLLGVDFASLTARPGAGC